MKLQTILAITILFSAINTYAQATEQSLDELLQESRAYVQEHDLENAQLCCEHILEHDPNNFNAHFQLGLIAYSKGEYDKALEHYNNSLRTIGTRYNPAAAHHNIGIILHEQGEIAAAYASFEQAIKNAPYIKGSRKHLAEIDLMHSEWQKGWQKFEFEWEEEWPAKKVLLSQKDLSECTILIRDGDGFGDTFNWIRYAQLLKNKHATVIVHTRPTLMRMLQMCPYIDQCIPWNEPTPECTVSVAPIQLNMVFASSVDTIPASVPYLFADRHMIDTWHTEIPKHTFNIGICWECRTYKDLASGKQHIKRRSIPLNMLYQLSDINGVKLFSLQKNGGIEQINALPTNHSLHVFGNIDTQGAFTETAAIMKNLNLVLTIDTSIAHLAGALGIPVWVMLPYNADWRFFMNRDDSPWYPTMRLFRQPSPDDWDSVIADIKHELTSIVNHKKLHVD